MTTLQEAGTKALDALRKAMQGNLDFDVALEAFEALRTALAQQELPQKERPDFMAGYDAGMADAKRMAQQVEQPTQRQLDTAMRQWETWKAYALELQAKVVKYEGGSPMILNAAAPAPQAQDKSDNYLSGYCTGRTDLLKEQSAQPVAQITDAAIREIADCIVSNLDSRKGVINLDLDDDLVEEIMQEMCDTIAHGIREMK